jgi:hypothetical protein
MAMVVQVLSQSLFQEPAMRTTKVAFVHAFSPFLRMGETQHLEVAAIFAEDNVNAILGYTRHGSMKMRVATRITN